MEEDAWLLTGLLREGACIKDKASEKSILAKLESTYIKHGVGALFYRF